MKLPFVPTVKHLVMSCYPTMSEDQYQIYEKMVIEDKIKRSGNSTPKHMLAIDFYRADMWCKSQGIKPLKVKEVR